ncbi:hypothetical protein [Denitromonas sp.]|uniref:hypothetical protein n=1 Tax=Denitromonas sp. TaxID=2734609 RepID=UPI003A8800EB
MSASGRHFPADARAALDAGRLIDAIKIVRERHGLGLAEAKAWVEAEREAPGTAAPAESRADDGELPAAARAALAGGRVIDAIKIVRIERGLGLKAAKERVDRHVARSGTPIGHAAPGERPSALAWGLLLAALVAGVAWVLFGG